MNAANITAFSKTLEKLRVEDVPDPTVTRGEARIKDPGCLGKSQ
jgi:hypothetical protein